MIFDEGFGKIRASGLQKKKEIDRSTSSFRDIADFPIFLTFFIQKILAPPYVELDQKVKAQNVAR